MHDVGQLLESYNHARVDGRFFRFWLFLGYWVCWRLAAWLVFLAAMMICLLLTTGLVWMHCWLLASPVWSRCSESRTRPGWERARTATTKSMIRSWQTCSCPRRRIPRLEASIPRKIFLLLGRCGGLSLPRALPRNLLSCLRAGRPAVHLRIFRLRRTGDFVFLFGQQRRPSRAHNVCGRLHTQ